MSFIYYNYICVCVCVCICIAPQVTLVVKNPPASAGDIRDRFHPWVGKIPWRRARQPAAVFLPGESHGQRSLAGYRPWGHTELDTAEVISMHTCPLSYLFFILFMGNNAGINLKRLFFKSTMKKTIPDLESSHTSLISSEITAATITHWPAPALEGEVSTTEPPGKFCKYVFILKII